MLIFAKQLGGKWQSRRNRLKLTGIGRKNNARGSETEDEFSSSKKQTFYHLHAQIWADLLHFFGIPVSCIPPIRFHCASPSHFIQPIIYSVANCNKSAQIERLRDSDRNIHCKPFPFAIIQITKEKNPQSPFFTRGMHDVYLWPSFISSSFILLVLFAD